MQQAAVNAARLLSDSTAYNRSKGIPIELLFKGEDLAYFSKDGMANVVALFEEVNKNLPKGKKIEFVTDSLQLTTIVNNPLALDDLRMKMSSRPASISGNRPQWQENIYQAYMARDYGTKLENTITLTSATREIREVPQLALIDFDGSTITLAKLGNLASRGLLRFARNDASGRNDGRNDGSVHRSGAERKAVDAFRLRTFPNEFMSKEAANENYRRALFALIDLQQADFGRHKATRTLIDGLYNDLKLGTNSKVVSALKRSSFYDVNFPGNFGPVLLTESEVVNTQQITTQALDKAMELLTLTALHYGERDAVKLFNRILNRQGALDAASTSDFSRKRLGELTYHGTEKFKSLGFGPDKVEAMTIADLMLVAVAAPAPNIRTEPIASLTIADAAQSVLAVYRTEIIEESKSMFQLNPRISLGSRYTTYKAENDPIKYAKGTVVTQNGLELRLESDLYYTKLDNMLRSGVKPFIYPEFGIILGRGQRKVGYDERGPASIMGDIPKFKQSYNNWGGHLGLNVGPVLVGVDATTLSTKLATDPYQRFFDLSQSMTYYRYSFLARVVNVALGKKGQINPYYLTFDLEMAGETNNEGTSNRTSTQDGNAQIASNEWERLYNMARPNGVYSPAKATQMLMDGSVKAAYPAANYGAMHVGLLKSGFLFKLTGGLYNRTAIDGYHSGKDEWMKRLFKNTWKGSGFMAASVTYNFGSNGQSKTRRTTRSSMMNGIASTPEIESSSSSSRTPSMLRNRAIFMSK